MSVKPLKIAVLLGGWSAEREVSLTGGAAVVEALKSLGHHVSVIDAQRDLDGLARSILHHADGKPDVVFNALHGRGGEDGMIQGVLEYAGLPYTHSNVLASSIAMDKPAAKKIMAAAGVRVPDGRVMTREDISKNGYPFPAPFVVKPINEGSSVGVKIVRAGENSDFVKDGWVYGPEVLIERYIPGRELTVGLMGGKALCVTEIRYKADFYDYTVKYSAGHATHDCPAKIPEKIAAESMRIAELSFKAIGCNGIGRIDLRWDESKTGFEGLYFLEMNTQPGFTPLSLVPEQAKAKGISFAELCQWIVEHPVVPA